MPTGVYPRTEATRKKMSQNNPRFWLGKHRSKKTKIKISESKKGVCGGEKHPSWKGGRIKTKVGYVYIWLPNHPFANNSGYVAEHRLIIEQQIGRYLKPEEVVHHRGTKYPMSSYKDRGDNRPKNLKLFSNDSEHQKFHQKLLHSYDNS